MACKRSSVRFRLAPPSFARCASYGRAGPTLNSSEGCPAIAGGEGGHPGQSGLNIIWRSLRELRPGRPNAQFERRMSRHSRRRRRTPTLRMLNIIWRPLRELPPGWPNAQFERRMTRRSLLGEGGHSGHPWLNILQAKLHNKMPRGSSGGAFAVRVLRGRRVVLFPAQVVALALQAVGIVRDITIFEKLVIAPVRAADARGMLDRAPVLFGA